MFAGLLGDEAKLAFRTRPNGIARLAKGAIPDSDTYWNQFMTLFDSPSDVYALILPNDIRKALHDAPENVATLIRVICTRMFELSASPSFPSSSSPSVAAFASSFMRSSSSSVSRNTTKEVLNCIRILQRVLPVVFEVEGSSTRFEMDVFWRKPSTIPTQSQRNQEEPDSASQFVIEDDEDDETDAEPSRPASPKPRVSDQLSTAPSLAERLFSCLTDLMFCCGFTLPSRDHEKITFVIWDKGIGCNVEVPSSPSTDANKAEVLRLLLVLLSRPIYTAPSSLLSTPSFYSLQFVQKTPRRHILTILCSLINTAYRRDTRSSLLVMKDKLPYHHLVFKGQDSRTTVIALSLQVLCAALDFQSGSARDKTGSPGDALPTARTNALRHLISKLHREQDFTFLIEGIDGILQSHLSTTAVDDLLPGSKKGLPYVVENVFFVWAVVGLNKKFRSFMMESDIGLSVIVHLLIFCMEATRKSEDHGACRVVSYILQTLSVEPAFHKRLTTSTLVHLPPKWGTQASFIEFWVTAVQYIMIPSATVSSMHPAFLVALANTAPYLRGLSVSASSKLIQLLTSFSDPRFLLSAEGHPRMLFFVLEAFNAILQHGSRENPTFVAAVVNAHPVFAVLSTFNLVDGLRRGAVLNRGEQESRQFSNGKQQDRFGDSNMTRPLSPASSPSHDASAASQVSVKQKLRQGDANSTDLAALATSTGRNGFVPTEDWVVSWQSRLPLDFIQIVIFELKPYHEEIQHHTSSHPDTTKSPSLPSIQHLVSHPPLVTRAFIMSDPIKTWASSTLWGELYIHNMTPLGIWVLTNVRLFHVKQTSQAGLFSEAVGVVGGLLRRS